MKTIGVAAPSSGFDAEKFRRSVSFLESLGFRVVFDRDIFSRVGYLAGSDERRAGELNSLFLNDDVDVIMCARGGYGSSRIIDALELDRIKGSGKVFIGASDICSILFYLENSTDLDIYFGPFVTEMDENMDRESLKLFMEVISGGDSSYIVGGLYSLLTGKAEACITGGCLSIIEASLKTPYEIVTDGKIVFIEDVSEPLYRVDRMLTHLKNAGKFDSIAGVIVGSFKGLDAEQAALNELISGIFSEYGIPVVTGFPSGHGDKKYMIPFKKKALIDAENGVVQFQ